MPEPKPPRSIDDVALSPAEISIGRSFRDLPASIDNVLDLIRGEPATLRSWERHRGRAARSAIQLGVTEEIVSLVVLIEDQRFWLHPGIDPIGIARALSMAIRRKGRRQGASTITEQVIKLSSPPKQTTIVSRSGKALKSIVLTTRLTKLKVLREYLHKAYFGKGAFGIEAACQLYFSKSATQINPHEAFFIVERLAIPNQFRLPRVRNILRRQSVRQILAHWTKELPALYGRRFGFGAEEEMAELLAELEE